MKRHREALIADSVKHLAYSLFYHRQSLRIGMVSCQVDLKKFPDKSHIGETPSARGSIQFE
jgi:hypothetical protein